MWDFLFDLHFRSTTNEGIIIISYEIENQS